MGRGLSVSMFKKYLYSGCCDAVAHYLTVNMLWAYSSFRGWLCLNYFHLSSQVSAKWSVLTLSFFSLPCYRIKVVTKKSVYIEISCLSMNKLWVRYPLQWIKYLICSCSDNEAKCSVESCYSICHVSKIRWK